MTKLCKNLILSVFTAIAFLFAGLFIVGCNSVDYSNVSIMSDVSSVQLEKGEQGTIRFTIENANSSFYKVLKFSVDNDSVVQIASVDYDDNIATVTINALSGGSVNMTAMTEEGYKWTSVRVDVIEHSSTMEYENVPFYLTVANESESATPLSLSSDYYHFSPNTTDKAVTFYYLYQENEFNNDDISSMRFNAFGEGAIFDTSDVNNIVMPNEMVVEFEGENTRTFDINALRFDSAIVTNGVLELWRSGELVATSDESSDLYNFRLAEALIENRFNIIAFYNYSIYANETLPVKNYLNMTHEVQIYQNLGVEIFGGYLKTAENGTKTVDLTTEVDVENGIKLLPNNSQYDTYILKVTSLVAVDNLLYDVYDLGENLSVSVYSELPDDIGVLDAGGASENSFYVFVNTSAFSNRAQTFGLYLRYSGMEGVSDDNVNFDHNINVDMNLVPTEILLNGVSASLFTSPENRLMIYNYYRYPDFGWRELNITLSSGLDATPAFSYLTFTYDDQLIDIKQGENGVVDSGMQMFDITTSFFYRGHEGTNANSDMFTIEAFYVVGENEVISTSCNVYFDLVEGARVITRDSRYGDNNGERIYIDMQASGAVSLGDYLHTTSPFQGVTVAHVSGDDVVSFNVGEECCVENVDEGYYVLNLSVNPIRTGVGMYRVTLDNNVFQNITIEVINTLKADNFGLEITSLDNVGYYEYKQTNFDENDERFNNTLQLEILNSTMHGTSGYDIIYDSEVGVRLYGNITSVEVNNDNDNVVSVTPNGTTNYVLSTVRNGEDNITLTATGRMVNSMLNQDDTTLNYYIEAKSYSLLDEFYLMNEGRYAVDNVVYYGHGQSSSLPSESTSVQFDIYAENQEAFGFYKYKLSDSLIEDIIAGDVESTYSIEQIAADILSAIAQGDTELTDTPTITLNVGERYVVSELEYAPYDPSYIYFYADANSSAFTTSAEATLTVTGGGVTATYTIYFAFDNGIIFDIDDISSTFDFGGVQFEVNIAFTNQYRLAGEYGAQGRFDFNTLTYTHTAARSGDFVLHAYLRQRNYTEMQYDARIVTSEYIQVDRISTASSIDEIVFTNGHFSESFVILINPTTATNATLRAQFVADNLTSSGLVTTNIIEQDNGVYLAEVSIEDYYEAHSATINTEESALSGTLYIFPEEWGDDYSGLEKAPIRIEVSYRNGTEANRYILDSPDDVLGINNNHETLSSHYEIRTTIDMSTVSGEAIGFVNGELVGFSGSIVGTTSQASITNINISLDNSSNGTFVGQNVNNYYYLGLFAQINYDAYIKNVTISGTINVVTSTNNSNYYIGLVTGVNYGRLSNVSALVSGESSVLIANNGEYAIGALAGENGVTSYMDGAETVYRVGEILQNFNVYVESDEEISSVHTITDHQGEFAGQSPKNMANYRYPLEIVLDGTSTSAKIYAGGVVGRSVGDVYRIDNSALNVYGYSSYSSYANIEITRETGAYAGAIYAGGAIGYLAPHERITSSLINTPENSANFTVNENPIEFASNATPRATIYNLLVGGEVNNQVSTANEAVGGIVGYVEGSDNHHAYLLSNTSRAFVRGYKNVGGIVGYESGSNVFYLLHESYKDGEYVVVDNARVVLENTINSIEAVDEGASRTTLESSMMILYGNIEKLARVADDDTFTKNLVVAIGNAYDNGRDYRPTSSGVQINYAEFEVISYLERTYIENGTISRQDTSTSNYYGDYLVINGINGDTAVESLKFERVSVNLGLRDSNFAMTSDTGADNVFIMFNFNATLLDDAEGVAQDYIDEAGINKFSPNSALYPFAINTRDAQIMSASTNLLRVDADGSLTTYSNGQAVITLQSILNAQTSLSIYLYIIDYMDISSTRSIFYSSDTLDGTNIIDGTSITVYGTRQTTVYAVPSYALSAGLSYELANGERREVKISPDGTLTLNNVSMRLNTNDDVTISAYSENPQYTNANVMGQSILFTGNGQDVQGTDSYTLNSYLETEVNGATYRYAVGASKLDEGEGVDVDVRYRDTATNISLSSDIISIKSNDVRSQDVHVTSRNDEFVYYEIVFDDGNTERIIQSRMSTAWAEGVSESEYDSYVAEYLGYMNTFTNNDLFYLVFEKEGNFDGDNVIYDNDLRYSISVNKESTAYQNRARANIYGTYYITFYANELYDGVSARMMLFLSEAEISQVQATNYSDMNDMSMRDDYIIPSQYGLLEINIAPSDAEFNTFTIRNDDINYAEGANLADFTFVYRSTTDGVVRYLTDINFGATLNGDISFTYEDYVAYLEARGEKYDGKVYIRYLLGSLGVEDEMPIRFNIEVTNLSGGVRTETVDLTTKLENYAHLSFDDREESDTYFVARGLDYNMTLDYYGFGLDDISVTLSNTSYASLERNGSSLVLNITDSVIVPTDEVGYRLNIYVNARRESNNVVIEYSEILTVYIMEFVFNYQYVEGENADLVRGMENGVISTAVGNAYSLEADIWDFLEYDDTNNSVIRNVQEFINSLTRNVTFQIYDSSTNRDGVVLGSGVTLRSDYYYINGLVLTGISLYEPEQDIYHFSMSGYFVQQNGLYVVATETTPNRQEIYTEFAFHIHQQSTDESPLPVRTYEDLMNMEDGQYYILLSDIVLPNSDTVAPFTPITAQIASLDGNGYSLLIGGAYTFDNSNVGIFETLGTSDNNAVIKNLTIRLYQNTTFTVTSTSFNLGVLVGANSGIITNSEVVADNNYALSVINNASNSVVAGFVGQNNGIITNSRSSLSLYTENASLSGFVGRNAGLISSSYFKQGSLRNETTSISNYTAGFVINNSGEIYTSYVSGNVADGEEVYSRETESLITSHNAISGFAFTNAGTISNCYSNIYMRNTSSYASGFVYENQSGGNVSSSFSTSVLTNNSTLSYGFAFTNSGTISDAYYLSDEEVNNSIATVENNANTSIKALTIEEFGMGDTAESRQVFAERFKNFVYSSNRGYNAVWFYNSSNSSSYYAGQNFNLNRLELVAPNIIAFSQRYLYDARENVDPETGVTTVVYYYNYTEASGEVGSLTNPILLDNAENFEEYILNESGADHYNFSYYRLINNIDYSEYAGNSEIYRTRFMGYFEGNFLTISNIHMVTSENMMYAGLFAEVGSSTLSNANGTVMNFNLEPTEMVFTNTQVVGGIAGRVDSGVIANINILSNDDIMISANNIAGGIVGLAVGNYNIENVTSMVSARATYIPESAYQNVFEESSNAYNLNSFAGAIVGVAGGRGVVNKAEVDSGVAVIGGTAGTLVGYVGQSTNVSNLTLQIDEDLIINAFYYGGLAIGESAGTVDAVEVIGTGIYATIFNNIPNDPVAVGGVVGLISGGNINDVTGTQSLSLSSSTHTAGVSYLGGFAGAVSGSAVLSNINIEGSYIGFSTVGGILGAVTGENVVLTMTDINFTNGYLSVLSTQQSRATIGGVIGSATESSSITITSTLSDSLKTSVLSYANSLYKAEGNDTSYLEFINSSNEDYEASRHDVSIYDTLSTDIYTGDDRRTLNANYLQEANKVQFSARVLAYVYGTSLDIYLGEIIGNMAGTMVFVNNTVSVMTANIESYDMGTTNPTIATENANVTSNSYEYLLYNRGTSTVGTAGLGFTNNLVGVNGDNHIIQTVRSEYTKSMVDENGATVNNFGANMTRSTSGIDALNYMYPIYNQNISYTFYLEGNVSNHALHLNNYGMCVGNNFVTF